MQNRRPFARAKVFAASLILTSAMVYWIVSGVRNTSVHHFTPDQLFLNNGDGAFSIANEKITGIINNKMVVRGVAIGDYDKDGDQDLLLTENNGPAHLWRNDSESKNYLRVNLLGVKSNKDGIGSKVLLYINEYKIERLIRTGSSYLSQSEKTATFGLGDHDMIDSLSIYWPSGKKETYFDIEINKEILIKEGFGEIELSNKIK